MTNAGTIIAALGGSGALAALVTAITAYFKTKTAAEERKKETAAAHKKMAEEMTALRTDFAAMKTTLQAVVAEAAVLREDNVAKDKKIARLENENGRLIQALPARAATEKKKD